MIGKIYINNENFKSIQFIEVKKISEYIPDDTIPTLLVGKKDVLNSGFKISLLNRNISKNLYWTFSKFEKRNEHENDINQFYKHIFHNIFKNIKYNAINVYYIKYSEYLYFIKRR